MTLAQARRPIAARGVGDASALHSPLLLAALGLAMTLAMCWPSAVAVWRTGAYANTDDAMRLVEVRDWLAGQPWFDLHQYRLDPPYGVQMHWTRTLDAPLGLLIKIFSVFVPTAQAERLTRIVFPLALQFGLFAAIAGLARRLAGPAAMLPAVMIGALTGVLVVQFQPGRIHHHTAQILLVVLIVRASVDALESARVPQAVWAAALAALSLSINVENIPYVLVEVAAFALAFVAQGGRQRAALASFALSLAGWSLVAFVATVGPARYFVGACDAFSTAHLLAIFVGAASLALMAAFAPRLGGVWPRAAACALGGVLVLAAMAFFYPACLHDPQAGVDPLLRRLWLDHVEEAQPLAAVVLAAPVKFVTFALAVALGFAALLAAVWRERGQARLNWLVVAAFAAIGVATSLWQIRALSSASAVALFGGVWVVAKAMERAREKEGVAAKLTPILLLLPFCSVLWAIAAPAQAKSSAAVGRQACRTPAAIDTLNALPKSVIMAPIDMGSDILADTGHSVLAAPYHRNNRGNGALVRAMLAPPDAARAIVERSGAAYVVYCPQMAEFDLYAEASPDGLAAALRRDETPAWLAPQPLPGSPYRVYKVR